MQLLGRGADVEPQRLPGLPAHPTLPELRRQPPSSANASRHRKHHGNTSMLWRLEQRPRLSEGIVTPSNMAQYSSRFVSPAATVPPFAMLEQRHCKLHALSETTSINIHQPFRFPPKPLPCQPSPALCRLTEGHFFLAEGHAVQKIGSRRVEQYRCDAVLPMRI